MYVECPMRIFGYSNECVEGTSLMLNEFYKKYRDIYNITIFSNEIEKSKPATLMFLARMGILVDSIEFFPLEDFTTVNEKADIIITNNQNIIKGDYNTKYIKIDIIITNNQNIIKGDYDTKYIKINQTESHDNIDNVISVESLKNLVEDEYIERKQFHKNGDRFRGINGKYQIRK
jgi:hypothetical protein